MTTTLSIQKTYFPLRHNRRHDRTRKAKYRITRMSKLNPQSSKLMLWCSSRILRCTKPGHVLKSQPVSSFSLIYQNSMVLSKLIAYLRGQIYCTQRKETGTLFTGMKSPLKSICGKIARGANCTTFSTDATLQPTRRARPDDVMASN